MIQTPGLRLALIGGIVIAVSLIALAFVAETVPVAAMMIGGLAVIGGFVWSLAEFYITPTPPPDEP